LAIDALIDSNVLIAIVAEAHEYHRPSLGLLIDGHDAQFAVAAHSCVEAYNTLTRGGERAPFQFSSEFLRPALFMRKEYQDGHRHEHFQADQSAPARQAPLPLTP
jgi:hypothetical protein